MVLTLQYYIALIRPDTVPFQTLRDCCKALPVQELLVDPPDDRRLLFNNDDLAFLILPISQALPKHQALDAAGLILPPQPPLDVLRHLEALALRHGCDQRQQELALDCPGNAYSLSQTVHRCPAPAVHARSPGSPLCSCQSATRTW